MGRRWWSAYVIRLLVFLFFFLSFLRIFIRTLSYMHTNVCMITNNTKYSSLLRHLIRVYENWDIERRLNIKTLTNWNVDVTVISWKSFTWTKIYRDLDRDVSVKFPLQLYSLRKLSKINFNSLMLHSNIVWDSNDLGLEEISFCDNIYNNND